MPLNSSLSLPCVTSTSRHHQLVTAMASWRTGGEGKERGSIQNEAGRTGGRWQLLQSVKEWREQDTVWAVSGEAEPPSHLSTPHTENLINHGDKGKTLGAHLGYRVKYRFDLYMKERVTWTLEDLGTSGSHLTCPISQGGQRESQGIPLGSCSWAPSGHPSLSKCLHPTKTARDCSPLTSTRLAGGPRSVHLVGILLRISTVTFWKCHSD